MNDRGDPVKPAQAGLYGIMVVLLSIFVAYPLAGSMLTLLATGGRHFDEELRMMTDPVRIRLLAVQVFGQVALLAVPALWFAKRFNGECRSDSFPVAGSGTGKRGGLRSAAVAAIGMALLQPFLYSLVGFQNLLLPHLGQFGRMLTEEQLRLDLLIRALSGGDSLTVFFLSVLAFVLTPAICEELFFRGFLQKSLAKYLSTSKAVLITGFVFALFHQEWFNLLPLTLLGWYIGYIYMRSDDLLAPVVAHGTNNLAALVLLKWQVGAGRAGDGASGLTGFWQWWILVLCSLLIFSVVIRMYPAKPAESDTDNFMTAKRF